MNTSAKHRGIFFSSRKIAFVFCAHILKNNNKLINSMSKKRQSILEYLQTIPKWKVATYKYIAQKFETHPRAVASIMRTNKYPDIYPCYKVVSVTWDILWYSAGEWPKTKIELLERDWIVIKNNKVWEEFLLK